MAHVSPEWVVREEAARLDAFLAQGGAPSGSPQKLDDAAWRSLFRRAGEAGLLCPWLPATLGGRGASPLVGLSLVHEAARRWCHAPPLALVGEVVAPYLLGADAPLQHAWLPRVARGEAVVSLAVTEPDAGSDPASITTSAVEDGDHYVVRGEKTFVACARHADLLIVAVRTGKHHRATGAPPHAGVSLLAVEASAPGVRVGPPLDTIGLRELGTADVTLEDVVVPRSHRIGPEGGGLLAMQARAPWDRLVWSVAAAAMSETVLATALDHARRRAQFGQPIAGFQTMRHRLAVAATQVALTRTFVDKVVREAAAGEDIAVSSCMARWWTAELVWRLSDECVQIHGARGYLRDGFVGSAFADARAWLLIGGTTEITKETLGRLLDL